MKKKKPPTLRQLIRKERGQTTRSLAAWSAIVRAGGRCDVCGADVRVKVDKDGRPLRSRVRLMDDEDGKEFKVRAGRIITTKLDAHHVLPKERYPDFKYEPLNGVCLCPKHHKHGKFSAHRNPLWFVLWLRRNAPEKYEWAKRNIGTEP